MSVLFINPRGIIFERTDYTKRSKVSVHNPDGYNHRIYRFNNVECFESPYISWENLDQCGGWGTDDTYLNTAVQKGTKLFAQIVHGKDESFEESDNVVVITDPTPRGYFKSYYWTHICRKGCLADYYDLDAVFAHYSRLGIVISDSEKALIREYCNIELSTFATEDAPFEYWNTCLDAELVVTGLLLGYPLESTASILEGF